MSNLFTPSDKTPPQTLDSKARSELRRLLRDKRRSLSKRKQLHAARQLRQRLRHSGWFHRAQHIALYLANDGEIDIAPLLKTIWQQGKQAYLPVVDARRPQHMLFAPYGPETMLKKNRFGIPEPVVGKRQLREARQLDLIIGPLVGFDAQGGRLGMGGGFYDRTLKFLRLRKHWRKPHFIGAAHHFQQLEALPHAPWDVPMEAVVTDKGIIPNITITGITTIQAP